MARREDILAALQSMDPNGAYTDEQADVAGIDRLGDPHAYLLGRDPDSGDSFESDEHRLAVVAYVADYLSR